jgi:PAS domain S-box-containing protein
MGTGANAAELLVLEPQLRAAKEPSRSSESEYRHILDNLEQSIFLKDHLFRFVGANKPFCQGLGCSKEDLVGKTDFDFYPAHLAEKYRADDRLVLHQGKRVEAEEQNLCDGKMRTVRIVKTPVRDEAGRITGVLGIFWDVSEQRTLEAQLRQAQKMEAVGQLAGGVAHDFNNLLTAILGNIALTLGALPPNDASRELLLAAESAALRASELTNRLLGFSRQTILRPQPTNLNTCVEETVRLLRSTIDPRITLEKQSAPDLWTVQADAGQMNQVLMNLCLNARDAMPQGGRLLLTTENTTLGALETRHRLDARPGDYVRLSVQDTGCGILPEIRSRIFDPFFTTKGPGKGTGLGLAMVFGIIKQHQGWIDCYSEIDKGTRFTVYLPRNNKPASSVIPTPLANVPVGGKETVLLADDESMIRLLGRTILQRFGYEVLLAEDGHEAVAIYEREKDRVGLVILDLTMPQLSGHDAFRRLLEINPKVRVLFASGYSAEHVSQVEHERIFGFIGKPYRPDELAQRVRLALDTKEELAG